MKQNNNPVEIAKSLKSAILKIKLSLETFIIGHITYALHRLKGGCSRSRLNKFAEHAWKAERIPTQARTDRHAVFVAYHPGQQVSQSNINYLQSLLNCGFQITYLHNGPLESQQRKPAEALCKEVICRQNIGQDFGAWKDWILDGFEQHRFQDAQWILLCNDSNLFLYAKSKAFESDFSTALSQADLDLIALNKNLEFTPHYQSYFICYNKSIFATRRFIAFWKRYKPLSNRYHTINKGEIELTSQVTGHAKCKLLYNCSDLFIELSKTQPKRSEFYSLLPKGCMYLTQKFKHAEFWETPISRIELHQAFMILELHNPSHALALLFVRYCNSPFIKKDIVKHGCYSIAQITDLLSSLNIDMQSSFWREIVDHFILTGNNASFINRPKASYLQGVPVRGQQFRGHGELMKDLGLTAHE